MSEKFRKGTRPKWQSTWKSYKYFMPEGTAGKEKILSKKDFYFETPLYEFVGLSQLEKVPFSGDVDAYSSKNSSDTTYSIEMYSVDTWAPRSSSYASHGYFFVKLICKRKPEDILRFFIYKDSDKVAKLGQYPSLADLQFSEIGKKYDKVLPKEDLKNLKKAIGLVAHGAGAGAFVYLRRIFENLIFETYKNNAVKVGISEESFKKQRMKDKVETIKIFLPSQLLQMKSVYSILSKGVHELTEDECLKYFGPLKLSIELILDEKIEVVQKEKRDAEVKKHLQEIQQELVENDGTGDDELNL